MKRLRLLGVLAALVVLASACDLSAPAASVGNQTVSRSQLNAQLLAISQSRYAQCVLAMQGAPLTAAVTGDGDYTVSRQVSSFELSTLVLERLIESDLADHHQTISSSDLSAARTDFAAVLTPSNGTPSFCPQNAVGSQVVNHLPPAFRDEQVRFLAARERLAAWIGHVDLSRAALLAYYQAHPSQFQEVCLSDIAVTTQTQAQKIHDAISSGAMSFAAEAQQNSIDQNATNGGQIPCVPTSQILNQVVLAAIAGLSPGQFTQPVFVQSAAGATAGDWYVLRLDGRPVVGFDAVESQIRQQLVSAQDSQVQVEFARLVAIAHVNVDPRFGRWSAAQGIQDPVAPPASELLPAAAQTGAGASAASSSAGAGGG